MGLLTFSSFNCNGHSKDRFDYIKGLMQSHDFVLLQEHWLLNEQFDLFNKFIPGSCVHGVSGMDSTKLRSGRPFGGCAILWNSSISCQVVPISVPLNIKRLCAVKICIDNVNILLCCVYMPCDTESDHVNNNEFKDILNEISCISEANNIDNIVIGGDLNTDFKRVNSLHTKSLFSFVEHHTMKCGLHFEYSHVDYSYESKSNHSRSLVDHFVITENLFCNIVDYSVIHDGDNLSDHSPISMTLNVNVDYVINDHSVDSSYPLQWHKVSEYNIACYKDRLDHFLKSLHVPWCAIHCNDYLCKIHDTQLQLFHDAIIDSCIKASNDSIPRNKKVHSIPGWNETVEPYKQDAIFWHKLWKDNGSPCNGVLSDIRRRTRLKYHQAVKLAKKNKNQFTANKLANNILNSNKSNFWQEVNKIKGTKSAISDNIDGVTGKEHIAELFANKFKNLYNSVSYNKYDMSCLQSKVDEQITAHCCSGTCYNNHVFSCIDVKDSISHLKKGKGDGHSENSSEHFIYGTNKLHVYLSLLMTSMFKHGMSPEGLTLSTIISIPKNKKKSLNSSDNYRGIALSSIIGKMLDRIIFVNNSCIFKTSDLQFGFKSNHSTTQCTYVVNEVIDYYLNKGGNVYVTLLDASKAFDKVNYVKLFNLLLSKGICPLLLRLLIVLYTNQNIRVKWQNCISEPFSCSNGVKQGGVLSPILFNIYIDELLTRFKSSHLGCHVGHVYMGAFAYADDITLLTPTQYALDKLLDIANDFSTEYDVTFNPDKTKLIVYSNDQDCNNNMNIMFGGKLIENVPYERHLGNLIGPNTKEKCVSQCLNDFYVRFNKMFALFNHADANVKYTLFKTYCMPLYSCQLWNFSDKYVNNFYKGWRKAIRRLLNVPNRTHSVLLPLLCQDICVETQLHKRFIKFFHNVLNSNNECVRMCSWLTVHGSTSSVSQSLNYICNLYDFDKFSFGACNLNRCLISMNDMYNGRVCVTDVVNATVISDLIHMRENSYISCFEPNDLAKLIEYLCTS